MVEPRRLARGGHYVKGRHREVSAVNSEDWRDSMDPKWPYSRASAQVRLVIDMYAEAGVTIGVHLKGADGGRGYGRDRRQARGGCRHRERRVVRRGGVLEHRGDGHNVVGRGGAR